MSEFEPIVTLRSLNGTTGFKLSGTNAYDNAGYSVSSAGDVNGDGFDDVIVGAFTSDANGEFSGSSYVVFGQAGGFAPEIELSSLDGTSGFRLDGVAGDGSGVSVSSIGDIDDDGFDDFAIGAYGSDANGLNSGATYVVFGRADAFAPVVDLSSLDGVTGFRLDGGAEKDSIGTSISAAGDVNNDGFDDFIIGTYLANPDGQEDAGSSYVVFGKDGGFDPTVALSSLDGTNGFRLDGIAAFDNSGRSVSSAGDIDGDGFDDLIVGAYSADPNGEKSGASYVVFGQAGPFSPVLNLANLGGTDGFRLDGAAEEDRSGISVSSAGDVNGDGFADLIVGADYASPNGLRSGSSYVVFGGDAGFDESFALSSLDGATGFRLDGAAASDRSGQAVSSAGDVNGDGFDDVIVGAFHADSNSESSGSTYVVFGKAGGFAAEIDLSSLDGATGFRLDGMDDRDLSGHSVSSAGDINDDGFDDILVGAFGTFSNGRFGGAAYAIFGRAPDAAVTRTGTAVSNTISGGAFDDTLIGLEGDDTLRGNGGRDLLEGGLGADALVGGDGIDTASYERAAAGVRVSLRAPGLNTGEAAGDSYIGVENVLGSDFDDVLEGDLSVNVIEGGGGGDLIAGVGVGDFAGYIRSNAGVTVDLTRLVQTSAGDADGDSLVGIRNLQGSRLGDLLTGDGFANVLKGGGGDDTLSGGGGGDTLDGGRGADEMTGGAGDDRYVVDDAGDVIVEVDGGGVADEAFATVDYTLADNVEIGRVFRTTQGLSLTGNGLDNVLFGGAGDDTLAGGDGDDRYVVSAGDTVVEFAGDGRDTVFTGGDFTLADNVEALRAYGAGGGAGLRLSGNAGANTIVGGSGADRIFGDGDIDLLFGGGGADMFVYTNVAESGRKSYDRIGDFASGVDLIDLSGVQAVLGADTDRDFAWIGSTAFSRTSGELRSYILGEDTLIEGDVSGDGRADFRIALTGEFNLSDADFIL